MGNLLFALFCWESDMGCIGNSPQVANTDCGVGFCNAVFLLNERYSPGSPREAFWLDYARTTDNVQKGRNKGDQFFVSDQITNCSRKKTQVRQIRIRETRSH